MEMQIERLEGAADGVITELDRALDFLGSENVDRLTAPRLRERSLQLVEDVHRRLWKMRRFCNNLLPFLTLPIEILIRILSLALNHDRHYVTNLLRLSRICHYIHYIVEQTPLLWAYLDTGFNRGTFNRVLSMSATALLDVTLIQSYHFSSVDELVPTVPRWRSASINNQYAPSERVQQISDICLQPAPMLVALELKNFVWQGAKGIPFGGITPKLSLVRADRVGFPWDRLMLAGLRELQLRCPLGLSVYALFSILAACPGLRRLELSQLGGPTEGANGSLGLPSSVQLPSLSHLKIFNVPYDTALQILTRISTPVLQMLEFAMEMTPGCDATPLMRYITPLIRMARERKSWEGCVFTLVLDHHDVALWLTQPDSGDGDARLIELSGSPLPISLPLLLQAMSDISPEQAVHIDFKPQSLTQNVDDVLDSLSQLRNTTKVSSSERPNRGSSLLDFLGTPRQSDRGIYQWPFPKLSAVDVGGPRGGIRRMVEGRYGLGLPKDAAAELPVPLRELILAGLWYESDLGKIDALVGDGVVQMGPF